MYGAMNKKAYVDTFLNNGASLAEGMVPAKFTKGPDDKDFRKENGNLVKDSVKVAKVNWKKAKQELSTDKVTLELLTRDNAIAKKTGLAGNEKAP